MQAVVADENINTATIRALRASGRRVVSIADEQPGAPDAAVLARAVELDAILVTFDRDYGALIFRDGLPAPHAVVYLRSIPSSPEEVARVVLDLLDGVIAGEIGRQFVVWTTEGTRKRKLPGR